MSKPYIVYEDYRGCWKIQRLGESYLILNSKLEEVDRTNDFEEAYALLHIYLREQNVKK